MVYAEATAPAQSNATAAALRLRTAAKRAAQSTSELGNGGNARQNCAGRYRK
jgi:hypothetical protein